MLNVETASKSALRRALAEAGVNVAGLDLPTMRGMVADMQAAPTAAEAAGTVQEAPTEEVAAIVQEPEVAMVVQEPTAEPEVAAEPVQEPAVAEVPAEVVQVPEVAPVVQVPVEVPAVPVARPMVAIEANRPMQNGVKRPSAGGLCRAVWDYCDAVRAETGTVPAVKTVKAHAATVGWNTNNASIEYYQWRKFNGISGRVA